MTCLLLVGSSNSGKRRSIHRLARLTGNDSNLIQQNFGFFLNKRMLVVNYLKQWSYWITFVLNSCLYQWLSPHPHRLVHPQLISKISSITNKTFLKSLQFILHFQFVFKKLLKETHLFSLWKWWFNRQSLRWVELFTLLLQHSQSFIQQIFFWLLSMFASITGVYFHSQSTDGTLLLTECGTSRLIQPHSNFRIFFTMDHTSGEISRAMRNCCWSFIQWSRSCSMFVQDGGTHSCCCTFNCQILWEQSVDKFTNQSINSISISIGNIEIGYWLKEDVQPSTILKETFFQFFST